MLGDSLREAGHYGKFFWGKHVLDVFIWMLLPARTQSTKKNKNEVLYVHFIL
jgi:hypothetical protein